MIVKEAIAEVISQKKEKVSYERFGNALNLTRQRIGQILEENLTENQILQIEKYFDVNLTDVKVTSNEPKVKAEYYPDVLGSCGGGAFELSQEHYTVELPVDCFFKQISKVKKYSVINAYGDSMLNTIKDGDKLIIEHTETEPIQDNKIYVFCYDNQIYVKRLINNIDELVVVSDNPDKTIYKTKYISKADRDNLYLIGQVVGLARNLR